MDVMNLVESLFRWIHVVAGILWIGLLYFFNWVNSAFAPTMDAETKKKVIPELLPRTLFWFRWGAAFTWVTGVLLLLMVFYHGRAVFAGTLAEARQSLSAGQHSSLEEIFLAATGEVRERPAAASESELPEE